MVLEDIGATPSYQLATPSQDSFQSVAAPAYNSGLLNPTANPAVFDDLRHNIAGHVAWDGEADSDVAASRGNDCGIQADELTAQVHQRSAGVARIDRGIGLDHVLDHEAVVEGELATEGADDARRERAVEAEGT